MADEEFRQRLRKAITMSGASSDHAFAKLAGVPSSTLTSYLEGTSKAKKAPTIERIASAAGVRPEWLTYGTGPIEPGDRGFTENSEAPSDLGGRGFLVPRLEAEAGAGLGQLGQQALLAEHIAFDPAWLRNELGVNLTGIFLLRARGDSMEPTIRDGDLLLIDRSQIAEKTDAIYLVVVEESLMVKRVQFLLKGRIKLASDNPAYEPLIVEGADLEQVRLIGRVVWNGRRM